MSLFLLLACCGSSDAEPDLESRATSAAVARAVAAGDVQGILRILPGVERVWDQDPEGYLRAVSQAVPVLRTSTSGDAKQALLLLFSNVLAKPSPADLGEATAYFRLNRGIVLDYLNLEEVRGQKAHLTEIARFVGEVRSRMIPGYTNRGTAQPGLDILLQAGVRDASSLVNPAQKAAYERAVQDNERDMMMNKLQLELYSTNEIITFHLLHCAARLSAANSESSDFLRDVVESAHLTATESRELERLKQ